MTSLFEHTSAQWAKYSDYEWRTAADGHDYLLPTPNATPSVYDPVPIAEQLVLDALNIGLLMFHKTPDTKLKDEIHIFARKYGLLGLMTALPTTPHFVEYERVYLLKNQLIREEAIETDAYLQLFFPFNLPDFHKKSIESIWQVRGEDRLQAALIMTFRNDPQAKAMSFMRDYGERFDWLKEIFRDWAFTFTSAFLYYQDNDRLNQSTLGLYRRGIACFEGNAPSYHLELRDRTVMVWDFHSLLMAVKFMLSLSLADAKNPLKMCEHCQKAFIAKRADARFCSPDCRKKHNM